jgi:transposase InsO family protein
MCRVLEVSTSGYYAWQKRPASKRAQDDTVLLRRIRTIHEASRQSYGVPRVYEELRDDGVAVGRDRIARLMRRAGLQGISRRRFVATTRRDEAARPAPDLVGRRFEAGGPNQLWVADITYVPTWAGFLYLAVVLDVWSRKVVGWKIATHLRTELVLDALQMAIQQRLPPAAQLLHAPHQPWGRPQRDPPRPRRSIREPLGSGCIEPGEPLVGRLPAHARVSRCARDRKPLSSNSLDQQPTPARGQLRVRMLRHLGVLLSEG